MKTTITQIDGLSLLAVNLSPGIAKRLRRVTGWTRTLLRTHDVKHSAKRYDPEFHAQLQSGCLRLEDWSSASSCRLAIDSVALIDAHLAVCLVAMRREFTAKESTDMRQVLELMAQMLPCLLFPTPLPRWTSIMGSHVRQPGLKRISTIYEDLRSAPRTAGGFVEIRLCDALVLRDILGLRPHPQVRRLWDDLSHVTQTHRFARQKMAQTRVKPSSLTRLVE